MKKIILVLLYYSLFLNCKNENSKKTTKKTSKLNVNIEIQPEDINTITPQEAQTFYKNPKKKYEYRTGKFNEYEYNYDVIGFDENNNQVLGNIITQGKFGAGILSSEKNNKIEVKVEWIGYGKLIAQDTLRNNYELEIKE